MPVATSNNQKSSYIGRHQSSRRLPLKHSNPCLPRILTKARVTMGQVEELSVTQKLQ